MKINNISFTYKKEPVLSNVSTYFESGKIYCIIGHNGAGKTTLLRLCLGLLKPNSGTIENDFKTLAYMPDKGGLYEDLTAEQNIKTFAELNCIKEYNVNSMLEEWHMAKSKNTLCKNLSTGLRQRLAFIVCSITNPQAMFLDEPTSGMDIASKELFIKKALELKNTGKCLVMVSHDLELIEQVADRIIIIDNQKIVFDENKADIENIKTVYLKYTNEDELL